MQILLKYFGDFTPRQLYQFAALDFLYQEWNEKINVISRKDIGSLYERHVLHSLSIAAAFEFRDGIDVVDLGTGGGFPGIPLAIFFPNVRFHLVDSIGKKLKVVDEIAAAVGLSNITMQHSRIEDIGNRRFDFVVSRAVAPLKQLWQWSKPVLKTIPAAALKADPLQPVPGLICLKGGDLAREIQDSHTRPRVIGIKEIFQEESFNDKFLLYVSRH